MLSKFGIVCKKNKPTKIKKNNRGSKNIKQHYTLSIRNKNIHKFHKNIPLTIDYKHKTLNKLEKIWIISKNPRPIVVFILFFLYLILYYFTKNKIILYLTIFTFIFAVIHELVHDILEK